MTKKNGQPSDNAKVLIYDIDRGLKSLATDESIEKHLGYKPRRFIRTDSLEKLFILTHRPTVIETEDILGKVEEEAFVCTKDIDVEVLDSITAFSAQTKKEVKGDADRISLPMWGEIGEALEDLVLRLSRTDTDVIILGHLKSEKDDDLGMIRYIPAISGRMGNEIGRSFDLVMHTIVRVDPQSGHREYLWQVLADERRACKCRIEEISKYAEKHEGLLPQDFKLIFELGHKYPAIKMLILGDTGTGKTYSLRTLKDLKRKRNSKKEEVAHESVEA